MHLTAAILAFGDDVALPAVHLPETVIEIITFFVLGDFSFDLRFAVRITLNDDLPTISAAAIADGRTGWNLRRRLGEFAGVRFDSFDGL